jgi:hypothetical protein
MENPYVKSLQKEKNFLFEENCRIYHELEDAHFKRIMWKGFFLVSAALNIAFLIIWF